MKQLLQWHAQHGSMFITSPHDGNSLIDSAVSTAIRYERSGIDVEINMASVEDRVVDRLHATESKRFDALLKKNQGTFMSGNVYGDAQVSQFVRSHSEIDCNGFKFGIGELRKADLKAFGGASREEFSGVSHWLKNHPEIKSIVYGFRTRKESESKWFGFLITDTKNSFLSSHICPTRTAKRWSFAQTVLDEAALFLTDKHHKDVVPLLKIENGVLEIFSEDVQAAYDAVQCRFAAMERA